MAPLGTHEISSRFASVAVMGVRRTAAAVLLGW